MEETPAEELPETEKPSEPITETTEVVIEEKPEQPQEVEITFEVPEEKQPEEVLLEEQPEDDKPEDALRETTEVRIEREPEAPQEIEITFEVPKDETVQETVTTTVTTITKEEIPESRETTTVSIEKGPEELMPIEFEIKPTEETPKEHTPHEVSEKELLPKESYPDVEIEVVMPEEDTKERTEIFMEKNQNLLNHLKLLWMSLKRKEEDTIFIELVQELTDVTVNIGDTATFTCRVIGFPRPTITWLINGNPLSDDRFISVYELDGICTLVITEVIEEDETVYELVATNEAGTVTTEAELLIPVDEFHERHRGPAELPEEQPSESDEPDRQLEAPTEKEITIEVPEEQSPKEALPTKQVPLEDLPRDELPEEEHPIEDHPVEEQPDDTLPEDFPVEDKPEKTFQDTLELTVDEEPRLPQEIQITFDIPEERQPDVEEPMEETPAEELPVTEKPSEPITETTEVVIEEKPEQPQEVEITFEVPEEKQPEEVLLEEQPEDDKPEDALRETTEVRIEREPEAPQEIEITFEVPKDETVQETVTTTVTTITKEEIPESRETTTVSIDKGPEELMPIEFEIKPTEETPKEHTPHEVSEKELLPKESYPDVEIEVVLPEEDTKERSEIFMEKEPEPLEPFEITVDVTEEKEEDTIFIELVQELTDVTVNIGDTATFTCRVIGFPRPTITWLINGNPLSDDRFISVYELDGICTLVITEVIEEDETVYDWLQQMKQEQSRQKQNYSFL
ncbi:putative titin-like [Apostichopus japonicus]|uniref:Putative titin-like n=1 Tax=Stichopus japonicus TaxID=307972 RepID=A0A2G8LL32_STIJA|nr:putative titin-like [Apostichopus japonicus]